MSREGAGNSAMVLRPIGVVRSEIRERKSMPPQGVPARIELFPEYAGGMLRLEKHSHIWVLAWLERAERDILQVTPRGVADSGPEGLHGVFAVRSPVRPNSIGLTATRIVRIEGLSISVDLLDFLDGTPVVDLKPYFVTRDMIYSANNARIGRPASPEAMRASLLRQAVNFHGEQCADVELAVRIVEHFQCEVLKSAEPSAWTITAPVSRGCLIDALMGMTRVSLGLGSLRLHEADVVRFEYQGRSYDYELSALSSGGSIRHPGIERSRASGPGGE